MNSNTKFFRLIHEFVIQSRRKLWIFQSIVTVSIFALFLGFVCGNLFGTFLNYFRNFVPWDGFIISLTILVIEFINYLNFSYPKRCSISFFNFFSSLFKRQPKAILESLNSNKLFYVRPLPFDQKEKAKADNAFRQTSRFFSPLLPPLFDGEKKQRQDKTDLTVPPPIPNTYSWIKILNFYKIGLLLGFFIDAFKVGS
jgi:hypothetical protein